VTEAGDQNVTKRGQPRKQTLLGVLLVLLLVVFVYAVIRSFGQTYPGEHHPYLVPSFLGALSVIGLYSIELYEWRPGPEWRAVVKVLNAIGEAVLAVCVVVLIFEIPDFKAFYEEAVRRVLTTKEYVQKLSAEEQRDMVRAVVDSRLTAEHDSAISGAFARDLLRRIDDGQYVKSESRYLEKQWTGPLHDSTSARNTLTREVQVFGPKVRHRVDDLVGGQFEYWVRIDRRRCLTIISPGPGFPINSAQTDTDRTRCATRIQPLGANYHIVLTIPLLQGSHTVERTIDRREKGPGGTRTDVRVDYVTQTMGIKFHYPDSYRLEALGLGDFEDALPVSGGSLSPIPGDMIEFDETFQDSWLERGSMLTMVLTGQSVDSAHH